jgi:uncharacterized delta-60 repeat protein
MTRIPRLALMAVAAFCALLIPATALGAAGDPDTSFNGTGKAISGFGTTPFHAADSGNAAARDGSGRIYIAGTTPANNDDLAVVRLTAAGAADPTFGTNGIVTTDVASGSDDRGTAVLIDTNGKVIVAGTTGTGDSDANDFVVARFTSAGVLDSGFGGGDGIVTTDFGGAEDEASGVAQLGSGNYVVAGFTDTDPSTDTSSYDFAVASYSSTGALDSAFDSDGKLTTDFGSSDDEAFAVLATGSTFVVLGTTDPAGTDAGDFAIARYTGSTGAPDNSFDTDGKETLSFSGGPGNGDFGDALALDGSGRLIVAGSAGPGNGDFAVARLSGTDGSPDNTFDTDGKQLVSSPASGSTVNSQDQAYAVAVQPDGKIVLAGVEYSNPHWMLARLSDAGAPDSTFGTNGIVLTDFAPTPSFTTLGVAVFADASQIVAAGTGDDNFAAARYATADGALDTTFGPNSTGKTEVDIVSPTPSSETATGVAVQPDGKTVVVGPTDAGPILQSKGDEEFGVARYNADGSLDPGFGIGGTDGNGLLTTNFGTNSDGSGTNDSPAGVALQSDGKIVVAGSTDPPGADKGDFAVARYLPDGAPDPAFGGGDGLVTTDFGGPNGDSGSAIAVEGAAGTAGFRIVVAGTKNLAGQNKAFAVAAYTENGTPDAGFGTNGLQTTTMGVYPATGVAIQPDGKVLVSGTAGDFFPFPVDFALVRYNADGTLDDGGDGPAGTGFGGGDGIATTDFAGGYDEAHAVAVEDLGAGEVRIVVVGRASPDTSSTLDAGIAAYTTDGSLDSTFGPDGDGKLTFDLGSNFDALRAVAFQPDGKIVASGTVESPGFGVVRVASDGSLDSSFGGDGLVSTSFGAPAGQYTAAGLALRPDGRIVAAGGPLFAQNGSDFFVARYGAPDVPTVVQPSQPPAATPPATPRKKKCKKKKKHRAASVAKKKCKKKRKG